MTKILIIEDEKILRDEVAEWLTLEGYEAISGADGIEGVDAALRETPDLIICDITMPRLDGYGVLIELRSHPMTLKTPFIFLTARAAHEDIRKGMSLGADDYILKPFTRLDLLDTIYARLMKKEAQEQEYVRQFEAMQNALLQEREQRLLKSKMVAMFSHDFRNPLAGILTSTCLLRDYADRLDEKKRRTHLNRIEGSVHQLMQMLDDMMLVAQMETGALHFNPVPMDLDLFFQNLIEEFRAVNEATHQFQFESTCFSQIMVDVRLLRQIASNLISNAIKYSPQGCIIVIRLKQHSNSFTLSIQDQGIGIAEEDQRRLFEAFQRGSNVDTISGTGLGLAIVKQSVDIHGGSIHLESQVGQGTTIAVTLPSHAK